MPLPERPRQVTVSIKATSGIADFHAGSETWSALADLCLKVAPDTCASCKLWYTNDGDGLNAVGAIELADALEEQILDGTVEKYIRDRTACADSLPDEICTYCAGSGVRTDDVGIKLGFDRRRIEEPNHPRHGQDGWCNGCDGRGSTRPYGSYFPLKDGSVVEELVRFLRASGGFRIW
jgi:hypothetical protein